MGNHSGNSDLPENSNWLKSQVERKGIRHKFVIKNTVRGSLIILSLEGDMREHVLELEDHMVIEECDWMIDSYL